MNDVLELWPSRKEGRGSRCQGPSVVPLPLPKERNHLITMVTPLPGTYLANMTYAHRTKPMESFGLGILEGPGSILSPPWPQVR